MPSPFDYRRRSTVTVRVGNVTIGSEWPIRVQSMTNTDTNDVERSAEQCLRIAQAGGEIVRLTAQGVREAESIGMISNLLRKQGCEVPLVADIHFNPRAALAAAALAEKVRINPGNFVDPARKFNHIDYTPEQYQAELDRIREALLPLIQICRDHNTALRIGVNHGSLSDRIMSRYGNTPAGMAESAMEFLRVLNAEHFTDVVISMKASNVVVMVEAVRRVVRAMDSEGMRFPLHLGVTEAGFGEDGRIKSGVGIGTLLADGLGDTVRVSLSEPPEDEIPVARLLVDYIAGRKNHPEIAGTLCRGYDPLCPPPMRRLSVDGKQTPVVIASATPEEITGSMKPDIYADRLAEIYDQLLVITPDNINIPGSLLAQLHELAESGNTLPVVVKVTYGDTDPQTLQVKAAADLGPVVMSHLCDGIWIEAPDAPAQDTVVQTAFSILQAARVRTTKTEFISCPSCGRTMFDLQKAVKDVQAATAHLTHLRIAVMGCIVNGPGEMADADYGYVGAARNCVSLFRNRECVKMNIPQEQAVDQLVELIKADGQWKQST